MMHTLESIKQQEVVIPSDTSPIVKDSFELLRLKLKVFYQLFQVSWQQTGHPLRALRMIRKLKKKYQTVFGEPLLSKVVKANGRYFWRFSSAGFPSAASLQLHKNEVNHFIPGQLPRGLRTVLFAITKRCPLNCEHCFEWDNLNQQEKLSTDDLIQIVSKYQAYGSTQIMFSGGEPMLRINDIYEILKVANAGTDFWIITSGLGLSPKRAQKLQTLGLTGVLVSLDHHDAQQHNAFRGSETAYQNAIQAILHAKKAGLVTALSLCATKTFVTRLNLDAYLQLAKKLGVCFVQILEPRATGRYQGKDVELSPTEKELLEEVYLSYNHAKAFRDYPIIDYIGYHQKRIGCFGSGDRFFYIDTDGDAHICPFCAKKVANTLQFSAKDMVDLLGQHACHGFAKGVI